MVAKETIETGCASCIGFLRFVASWSFMQLGVGSLLPHLNDLSQWTVQKPCLLLALAHLDESACSVRQSSVQHFVDEACSCGMCFEAISWPCLTSPCVWDFQSPNKRPPCLFQHLFVHLCLSCCSLEVLVMFCFLTRFECAFYLTTHAQAVRSSSTLYPHLSQILLVVGWKYILVTIRKVMFRKFLF